MASWQENLTSSGERLSHLFKTGNASDVTFIVGEGKVQKAFKLHKLILAMSSDVFFTMFYGSMPEKNEVRILDIQPDIFEIAMTYVYEDSLSFKSTKQAMHIYIVGEKYNIAHLRKMCIKYMTDNLRPENLPILYATPHVLEALQLKSRCQKMMSEKTLDILKSDSFVEAPLCMVQAILQMNQLNISSEVELFDFVIKWAKAFSSKENAANQKKALRSIMNNFLPHISFLAMSVQEFLTGPVSSGILTDSEIARISENLVASSRRELPDWCSKSKRMLSKLTNSFRLIENHICKFTSSYLHTFSCLITVARGSMILRGFSFYVLPTYDINTVFNGRQPDVTINGIFIELKEIERSYDDAEKYQLKLIFLNPFVLESLPNKYKISVHCYNDKIVSCSVPPFGNTFRRHQNLELNYYRLEYDGDPSLSSWDGDNIRNPGRSNYIYPHSIEDWDYPHFNEIFYRHRDLL